MSSLGELIYALLKKVKVEKIFSKTSEKGIKLGVQQNLIQRTYFSKIQSFKVARHGSNTRRIYEIIVYSHSSKVVYTFCIRDFKILQMEKWLWSLNGILYGPLGGLQIPLSRRFLAQIMPRNCLKSMFTSSLPNQAACQTDHSRKNAIFHSIPVFTL